MHPSRLFPLAGLLVAVGVLLAPRPAHAQTGILWDTVVEQPGQGGGAVRFVQPAPDGTVTVGGNYNGVYVARLSAEGAILWTTVLPQYGNEGIAGMGLGPEGQVYVLHQFGSSARPTGADVAVHRVDADGTLAWSRQYDGPNSGTQFRESDRAVDLAVDAQGRVFTTAQTGFSTNDNYVWSQMHAPDGTLLWTRTFDYSANGHRFPTPRRAGVDCAGNAYVIGMLSGSGTNVGIPSFFLSYGPDGTPRQEALVAPPTGPTTAASSLYLNDLAVACDGTAYVSGNQTVTDNDPQIGSSRRAFVSRFDGGSSAAAWTSFPYAGDSGSGNSYTSGEHNLALGGPDAIYASTESIPSPGATVRVSTVRLRADGSTAWLDPGVAGSSLRLPIAADASGVVVLSRESDPSGFSAYPYRHFSPDGVLQWEVRRVSDAGSQNQPPNGVGSLAMHPDGGAVWAESYAHVIRVGEATPPALARVQVVHASAALAALGPIEIYLNQPETSTTPDAVVAFRGGSAFVSLPADQPFTVRARLQNPPPPPLPREQTFTAPPIAAGRYVVSVAGIPEQLLSLYAANPDGRPRSLAPIIALLTPPTASAAGGAVAVVVTHAVTDAPSVDVTVAETGQVLADDLPYGAASAPSALGAGTHRIEVRRSSDGALVEAVRFVLDGTEDVFALAVTGFLDPAANRNGPALALTATDSTGTPDGGVVVTGPAEAPAGGLALVAENPVRGGGAVRFSLPAAAAVRLAVVDALGREVAVLAEGAHAAGTHAVALGRGLAPGAYVLRLSSGSATLVRRLVVVR